MKKAKPLAPGYDWGWEYERLEPVQVSRHGTQSLSRTDWIIFPSVSVLVSSLRQMNDWIHCFKVLVPYHDTHFHNGLIYLRVDSISYHEWTGKLCLLTRDDDGLPYTFRVPVHRLSTESIVFENQLKYRLQPQENGSLNVQDVVLYSDLVSDIYSYTYISKKIDLFPLLLGGTNSPTTSISRFFRNPLCERQVLNLVQQF